MALTRTCLLIVGMTGLQNGIVCTLRKSSRTIVLGFATIMMLTSVQAAAQGIPQQTVSGSASEALTTPIELPPAQEAKCRLEPIGEPLGQDCLKARHILALMSAESRDKVWADRTESYLQGWIESLASKGFATRNVECRLSWCVVEVASRQGDSLTLDLIEARKQKLFQLTGLYAPDIGASDPKITDVLKIFKRYCTSTRELLDSDGKVVQDFDAQGKTC